MNYLDSAPTRFGRSDLSASMDVNAAELESFLVRRRAAQTRSCWRRFARCWRTAASFTPPISTPPPDCRPTLRSRSRSPPSSPRSLPRRRAVPAPATARRGRHGCSVQGRAASPIRRTVAIKLIKSGFDTHGGHRPFRERAAGAGPDGPPARRQVLDAGSTDAGRPYFVMEYVPGEPITEFCDDNKLSVTRSSAAVLQVATRSRTLTRRRSSTGTSSRRTCWRTRTTASRR